MNRCLLCVFLVISAVACSGLDRRAFKGVESASRAIQTAIDGKSTVPQYRELLSTYSTALAAARARASTSGERALLAEYDAAFKGLNDIRLIWEDKEARGSDMLPIREELPARIAREYDLPVNTNEPPSIYADEALHTIWERALSHLRAASRALGSGL